MRTRNLLLALGIASLAGCLAICEFGNRYTCRTDGDCDRGGGQFCAGVDLWVDDSCANPPKAEEPFYVSDPELKTCYFYYCVSQGIRACGAKQCAADATCVGYKNDKDKGAPALECRDRQTVKDGTPCSGYDDTTPCNGGRCVRYIELKRDNPTAGDEGFRCVPQ